MLWITTGRKHSSGKRPNSSVRKEQILWYEFASMSSLRTHCPQQRCTFLSSVGSSMFPPMLYCIVRYEEADSLTCNNDRFCEVNVTSGRCSIASGLSDSYAVETLLVRNSVFVDVRPFSSAIFLQVMNPKSVRHTDREFLETLFACTVLDKDSCTGRLCHHNSFNSSYLALLNCRPMQMGRR